LPRHQSVCRYGDRLRADHWNLGTLSTWQADRQLRGMIPSEDSSAGKQRLGHQQAGQFLTALLAGGSGPSSTVQPRVETSVHSAGDASAQEHRQGSDGAQAGGPVVLDLRNGREYSPSLGVRFVRETARNRTWCEVELRPYDWRPAPRKESSN
jgi:hypothetical protein